MVARALEATSNIWQAIILSAGDGIPQGREPAPGTQQQFGDLAKGWFATERHCPAGVKSVDCEEAEDAHQGKHAAVRRLTRLLTLEVEGPTASVEREVLDHGESACVCPHDVERRWRCWSARSGAAAYSARAGHRSRRSPVG
jgi:hypothetical protein